MMVAALFMASGVGEAAPADPFGAGTARPRKSSPRRRTSPPRTPRPAPSVEDRDESADPYEEETTRPSPRARAGVRDEASVDEEDEVEEDERPAPRRRRRASQDDEDEEDQDDEDAEENDDDDGEDEPMASLPSILPRAAAVFGGLSLIPRRFETGPTLQSESALARIGAALALESFPFLSAISGWPRRFGIAASYGIEMGPTGVTAMDGSTTSFPARQSRWNLDLRYAFTPGTRVVFIPLVGLGHSAYDLRRNMPTAYSACLRNQGGPPCLPDTPLTYLRVGLVTRIAITTRIGLSLELAYHPVLGVGRAAGEIGNQAQTVQGAGYIGDLAVSWAHNRWLDWRLGVPLAWYRMQFSGAAVTAYPTGKELYFGVVAGAVVHTM